MLIFDTTIVVVKINMVKRILPLSAQYPASRSVNRYGWDDHHRADERVESWIFVPTLHPSAARLNA